MRIEPTTVDATVRHLRWGLTLLIVGSCLGAFAELGALHHWKNTQVIAWAVVSIVLVGTLAHAVSASAWARWFARVAGLVGVMGAAVGVWEHIEENLDSAPLAATWSSKWSQLSSLEQFWFAATGQAGPAPTLAPGMLALAGALLLLATWGVTTPPRPGREERPLQRSRKEIV